jgi:hypothetical protein
MNSASFDGIGEKGQRKAFGLGLLQLSLPGGYRKNAMGVKLHSAIL